MMTPTNMDETISDTDRQETGADSATNGAPPAVEAPPEAPPPPAFDSTPWPVEPRRVRRPVRISRPWGPRLWTATLAAALLVTAGGLALLYMDDTAVQNNANQLRSQNQALTSQHQALQAQLLTTQTNLTATLAELATVRSELEHPDLKIWTFPQTINGPDEYLAGGAPDTFTYHLYVTSNGPISVSILTLNDFADAIACVQNGGGRTNYCMHHTGTPAQTWTDVTSILYDFHLAEGCAGYVVVFTTSASSVTVTPNVSVTYNPAANLTGDCAK